MAVGLRFLVVVTALLLVAAPATAGRGDDDSETDRCASAWSGTQSGTNAEVKTANGYDVTVTAGGQGAFVHLLGSSCVGQITAKSSQIVWKTLEPVLEQAPPLP